MEGPSFSFDLCNISFSDFQFVGTSRFASLYMGEECLSFNPPKIWKDSKTGSRDYFYFVKILKNQKPKELQFWKFSRGDFKNTAPRILQQFQEPKNSTKSKNCPTLVFKNSKSVKDRIPDKDWRAGKKKNKTHERDRPKTKKRNKQG